MVLTFAVLRVELVRYSCKNVPNGRAGERDESRILTAGDDSTARVWNAQSGAELFRLTGHEGRVTQAVWNRDESRILTASFDGTVRQYYTRMADLLDAACQRLAVRNLSTREWQRFIKNEPYRQTCPSHYH